MATYALTVSTNALGLGVINGATVRIEKRRVAIADTYPPINNLIQIAQATNPSGITNFLLEPDDLTTYHVAKIFDLAGVFIYQKYFTMPPSAANLHDASISTVIGGSLIQFKENGNDLGTPTSVRNVDIVGSGVDATFVGDTVTIDVGVPYLSFVQTGTGAVARTMQEKMRESVSVMDFGAIGDGTLHTVQEWIIPGALGRYASLAALQVDYPHVTATTDSIDWAAAAAAVARMTAIGGTVVFPGGSYYMTALIDVGCDIDGFGSTILTAGSADFKVFSLLDRDGLSVRNLKFRKDGANLRKSYPVSVSGESKNIRLHNINADGYYSAVVVPNVEDGTRNAVFDVSFTNTATGGTWTLGFFVPGTMGQPVWASGLAWNISAAALQTALEAVLGSGNITVTGGPAPSGIFRLTFGGAYAGLYVQQPLMHVAPTGQKEFGGSVDTITEGGGKWVRNLILDNVVSKNAGIYGFEFNYVDGLQMIGCSASYSWFDGIKLRSFTRNTLISGGDFSHNGVSWFSTGANQWAGDGLDAYVGGQNLRIVGAKFNHNNGSGILIKNDDNTDASGYGAGDLGVARKIDIIGIEASYNRVANGLSLSVNKAANASYYSADITVVGGIFEGNCVYGIVIVGSRVTLNSVKCRRNGDTGIGVGQYSKYIEVNNCTSVANGRGSASGYGLRLDGEQITVNGGIYLGVDTDDYKYTTDLSALTKYHVANIRVGSTAAGVRIRWPHEAYNSSGRGIIVADSGGVFPSNVTIWQNPTEDGLVPGLSGIFGGPGSLVLKRDGTQAADRLFMKMNGTSGQDGIWRRIGALTPKAQDTSATLDGSGDVYLSSATSADTDLTLPAVAGMVGMEFRFTRISTTAFKVRILRAGSDTINGGTASILLNADGASVTLMGTSNGWRIINKSGDVT